VKGEKCMRMKLDVRRSHRKRRENRRIMSTKSKKDEEKGEKV
jgi:hypothetical protein